MSIVANSNRVGSTPKKETSVYTENIAWYRNQAENRTVDSMSMYRHLHHYYTPLEKPEIVDVRNLVMWTVALSETSVDMKHDGDGCDLWNVRWFETPDATVSPGTF